MDGQTLGQFVLPCVVANANYNVHGPCNVKAHDAFHAFHACLLVQTFALCMMRCLACHSTPA